jgi:hypothetical protein
MTDASIIEQMSERRRKAASSSPALLAVCGAVGGIAATMRRMAPTRLVVLAGLA